MSGIIYCRVSSKEQTQGTSLESQELACRDFARKEGIDIARVFVEKGESAKFANRTQLLEAIDFCQKNQGKIDKFLVWKIDRFSRNVSDHFSLKATLQKFGVRVISVTEPIDANPEGKLLETILAGFAQFDNDIRAMRVVQGMKKRLQQGIFPWKPPLGYKAARQGQENKTEADVPDRPDFDHLREAWRRLATGAYTKAEIRRLLVSWGVRGNRGGRLSPQTLDGIFRNKFYAGILVNPWDQEEYPGKHVPMVTPETFQAVQKHLKKKGNSTPHQKDRPEFPLRGLVRCPGCRFPMTASFSKGKTKRYPYYHCAQKFCLKRGRYGAQEVHDGFEELLDLLSLPDEVLKWLKPALLTASGEEAHRERDLRGKTKKKLKELDGQLQQLIHLRTKNLLTDQELLAQKKTLYEKRWGLQSRLARTDPISPEALARSLEAAVQPLKNLRRTWHRFPPHRRREFEHFVAPAGYVHGKIRTRDLGHIFRDFRDLSDGNAGLVVPTGQISNSLYSSILRFLWFLEKWFGRK